MASESKCPLCGSLALLKGSLSHTNVWQCTSVECGLQFAGPQPGDEALAQAYMNLYYPDNGNPVKYENTSSDLFRQMFRKLEQEIQAVDNLRLLDYGCGHGGLLGVAREFGLRITGIELDPVARKCASNTLNAPIYESTSALRSFDGNSRFDIITVWTVIEHLRKPWLDLGELRNLLRPGGTLIVSTMDTRCLRARLERFRWPDYVNPTHLYYFDKKSLERTIRQAGFSRASEWRLCLKYPQHGALRRFLYRMTSALGLSDGLFFICGDPVGAHAGTNYLGASVAQTLGRQEGQPSADQSSVDRKSVTLNCQ